MAKSESHDPSMEPGQGAAVHSEQCGGGGRNGTPHCKGYGASVRMQGDADDSNVAMGTSSKRIGVNNEVSGFSGISV